MRKRNQIHRKFEKVYYDPFKQFDPFGDGRELGLKSLNKSLKLINDINRYKHTQVVSAYQTIFGKEERYEGIYRPIPGIFMNIDADLKNLEQIISFFSKKDILPFKMVASSSKINHINSFIKRLNPEYDIAIEPLIFSNINKLNEYINIFYNINTDENPIDIIKFITKSPFGVIQVGEDIEIPKMGLMTKIEELRYPKFINLLN